MTAPGVVLVGCALGVVGGVGAQVDPWAPPAGFYDNVSGEGTALRQSLAARMAMGHRQQTYGDFRASVRVHDLDPDNPDNILLAYNRASVRKFWDNGSTWNREHVWPQSRQPGSASNSSTGNLGDPFALRPCNPSINSSRSNLPFGLGMTTGVHRRNGSYYFTGDMDRGDTARSLFYSSVRYGLPLVNGLPSGNAMGDLASQIAWHYLDIPDEFERQRNHRIYSQAENPFYYTNNRNAFIDMPGAVWSVFADSPNDSTLWVGGDVAPDGSSSITVDVGSVIAGGSLPMLTVGLHRSGEDGVYYAVTASGGAVTDQPLTNGFTDAYGIGIGGTRSIDVGVDNSLLASPVAINGVVTVDNLDMTSGLGPGFGALDADDTISVIGMAVAPTDAEFAGGVFEATIDLGSVAVGEATSASELVSVVEAVPGLTAGAAFWIVSSSGDLAEVDLVLPTGVVPAGANGLLEITVSPTAAGSLEAVFEIAVDDDASVIGADRRRVLELTVLADAGEVDCPADVNQDGILNGADFNAWLAAFNTNDFAADINEDGVLNGADFNAWLFAFSQGCG